MESTEGAAVTPLPKPPRRIANFLLTSPVFMGVLFLGAFVVLWQIVGGALGAMAALVFLLLFAAALEWWLEEASEIGQR